MLKLISNLISYLKKKRKIQAISENLFSYLKKANKIHVTPEILFSYLKKRKKIHIVSGGILIFLIILFFSSKESSDLDQNEKEKISTKLEEKKNYKPDDLSKNTREEVEKSKNKQATKDDLSKSKKPPEKKEKKAISKNQQETQLKNKTKELNEKPKKKEIKNPDIPRKVVNNLHTGLKKVSEKISDSPTDLINLVKNTYNAEKMITKIVGDTWKKTNKKDQQEIVIIFQEYIAKNYLKRFKKIKNPTFNYKESKKINEKLMLVKTILVVNKEEVSINYLLAFDKNKWRIFDVLLAGSISEIATKKSEFSGFIRDGKITPLIDALKKQNSVFNY